LLLSACGATPEVQVETQIQTVEVPVEVKVTEMVTQMVEVAKEVQVVVTATPSPENLPEGTLTIAIPTNIDTLDPGMGGQLHMMNAGYTAYEGLTFVNAEGQIEPLLAESWEVVDDTTWVFHLRQGVTFHNGEPFNADAVVYTWKRIMEPGRVNLRTWETVEDIEVIDDYTVEITTKAPDPLLLLRMGVNTSGIYPPGYATEAGDEGVSQAPVGTAPFKFVEWVRGEKVVFEAWPDYWGGPNTVGVQTVVWRTIPEADARLAALETGEVDIALQIPPSLIDLVTDNPDLRLARALGTRTFYLLFDNVSSGIGTPLEDQRVRLAMIHAIDRQAIVDAVFRGNGKVLATTVGPTQFGWDPSFEPLPYDPDKARQLLAEAGYPDGQAMLVSKPSG
ncbi:MAG: ABC transporter substrate-binding protein, partial [Anaerolineae bacterium]|nr:ABC transporter substrate-binding protein [Anaerolineae bacterium]